MSDATPSGRQPRRGTGVARGGAASFQPLLADLCRLGVLRVSWRSKVEGGTGGEMRCGVRHLCGDSGGGRSRLARTCCATRGEAAQVPTSSRLSPSPCGSLCDNTEGPCGVRLGARGAGGHRLHARCRSRVGKALGRGSSGTHLAADAGTVGGRRPCAPWHRAPVTRKPAPAQHTSKACWTGSRVQ